MTNFSAKYKIMEMFIKVYSGNAIDDAKAITSELKEKNLRGVVVTQLEDEPEGGTLSMAEFMPIIKLVVGSGFAKSTITGLFGLLKNGFFTESKRIESEERIAFARLKVELRVKCGEKERSFGLNDASKESEVLASIDEFSNECDNTVE